MSGSRPRPRLHGIENETGGIGGSADANGSGGTGDAGAKGDGITGGGGAIDALIGSGVRD